MQYWYLTFAYQAPGAAIQGGHFYRGEHHPLTQAGMEQIHGEINSMVAQKTGMLGSGSVTIQSLYCLPPAVQEDRFPTDFPDGPPSGVVQLGR